MGKGKSSIIETDLTVVGSGVTGLSIARELSRYRLKVAVIDREEDVCCGTSKANSGIIHTGIHMSRDQLKGRLALLGNPMFDGLSRELAFPFQRAGELVVAMNDGECERLEGILKRGIENGVPGLRLMDGRSVRRMEPNLSRRVRGALYAPTAGVVAPFRMSFALAENARANGVAFHLGERVIGCEIGGDARILLHTPRHTFLSPFVINAAGVYADAIARMAGDHSFTIHIRKGEEYILDRESEGLVRKIIFPLPGPKSKGVLVIPTIGGPVMIGPTAEDVPDREDRSTTSRGLETILASVRTLIPRIRRENIIASFSGLRACADGEDFVVGPGTVPGLIHAAGIQSPGLTAAPALAREIIGILSAQGLPLVPRKRFDTGRSHFVHFRDLELDEASREIDRNPAFGNIVCRCEKVSEEEIVEALRRGAKDLNGIKLRTRAGMGRCQGGFCTYRLIDILSRELGIPCMDVTRSGPGSEILVSRTRERVGGRPERKDR